MKEQLCKVALLVLLAGCSVDLSDVRVVPWAREDLPGAPVRVCVFPFAFAGRECWLPEAHFLPFPRRGLTLTDDPLKALSMMKSSPALYSMAAKSQNVRALVFAAIFSEELAESTAAIQVDERWTEKVVRPQTYEELLKQYEYWASLSAAPVPWNDLVDPGKASAYPPSPSVLYLVAAALVHHRGLEKALLENWPVEKPEANKMTALEEVYGFFRQKKDAELLRELGAEVAVCGEFWFVRNYTGNGEDEERLTVYLVTREGRVVWSAEMDSPPCSVQSVEDVKKFRGWANKAARRLARAVLTPRASHP